MQRAVASAIGLPSRSTSACRMLSFLMPADVRSSFTGSFPRRISDQVFATRIMFDRPRAGIRLGDRVYPGAVVRYLARIAAHGRVETTTGADILPVVGAPLEQAGSQTRIWRVVVAGPGA